MLILLYNSFSEPLVAPSHGARCLSSEHAVIAKEQTAQAIANTAHAYEKGGVEAALSEVRDWGSPLEGGLSLSFPQRSHFSVIVCLCCIWPTPLFLHFFRTHSLHSAAAAQGSWTQEAPAPGNRPGRAVRAAPRGSRCRACCPASLWGFWSGDSQCGKDSG